MIIASYRHNELHDTHPLYLIINYLEKRDENIHTKIRLDELTPDHTMSILVDTLYMPEHSLSDLNQLIYERTNGNPLFFVQYLQAIADENHITYNIQKNEWEWDLEGIKTTIISDDIVSLLISKIKNLMQ